MTEQQGKVKKEQIINALKKVYDPEIPVDIYEMGLIYDIRINEPNVGILMTLTSPSCPAAQSIPEDVKYRIMDIDGVEHVDVEIVWDPPWGMEMMSEVAKLELGYL
jgi:FeS assembly SUF system protein